jgi:hypothetical protein
VPQAHLLLLSQVELARMAETWRDGAEVVDVPDDEADDEADDDADDEADDDVENEADDEAENQVADGAGFARAKQSGKTSGAKSADQTDDEPGQRPARTPGPLSALAADVAELTGMGCAMVLVTCTGPGPNGARSNTLFDDSGEIARFDWQHLAGPFSGAGSTMSAAAAAYLAHGMSPRDAAAAAQSFTTGALTHARRIGMGKLVPNKFFQAAPFAVPVPIASSASIAADAPDLSGASGAA